jgi:hypothetical protein
MMPPQLARGLWKKRQFHRTEQRPLAEQLPHININDLNVPKNLYSVVTVPWISFRYPFISAARLSPYVVEFAHSGRIQKFRLKWIKTGFGLPRFAFICDCQRPTIKLYFRHGNLACRRCWNLTYASRTLDKRTRPVLQAIRLRNLLKFKRYMSKRNRQRLKARIATAPIKELKSKRLSHHAIPLPQSNYGTRGAMHWR